MATTKSTTFGSQSPSTSAGNGVLGDRVQSVLDDAGSKLSDAKSTVEQTARDAMSKARSGLDSASSKMQERPLLAIGIALGVGYLLGRLMAR